LPKISIVIPSHDEGSEIIPGLRLIHAIVPVDKEILVVVDSENDSSVKPVRDLASELGSVKLLVNSYGPGPGNAIKFGFDSAQGDVVVVSMADGCDDASQIYELARLVRRGVVVAAASRYMAGGQQVGGPRFKKFLSRLAGKSFCFLTGVGTRDATNSFKAYSRTFVEKVGIHSRDGFEIGIELVAKARLLNQPVAEIPTTWIDRSFGYSKFQFNKWLPKYLTWYLFGLGFSAAHKKAAASVKRLQEKK
jgi:glycosyltransferase involved in cell wall biosynthesis